MKKNHKKQKATDKPIRFFQMDYEGQCVSYMESQKHYFYCHDGKKLKRISSEQYMNALESYNNY